MHHHYRDICELIDAEPKWWDEYAVPRFCDFSPDTTADIYAPEVLLLLIECQNCGNEFKVCMSGPTYGFGPNGFEDWRGRLGKAVEDGSLHYGDPPNAGCCPAGPTMNSVPRHVLEFWERRQDGRFEWKRRSDLEIALEDEGSA